MSPTGDDPARPDDRGARPAVRRHRPDERRRARRGDERRRRDGSRCGPRRSSRAIVPAIEAAADRIGRRRPARLRRRRHPGPDRRARRVGVPADVRHPARAGRSRSSRADPAAIVRRARAPRTTRRPARRRSTTPASAPSTPSSASPRAGAPRTSSRPSSGPATLGALTVGLSCNVGTPLSAVADHPIEVARRAGGAQRVDPAEGGHGAEARAQHVLDDRDGAAGQDLRQPDGRSQADQRQAPRASGADGGRDRRRARATLADAVLAETGYDVKVAILVLRSRRDRCRRPGPAGGDVADCSAPPSRRRDERPRNDLGHLPRRHRRCRGRLRGHEGALSGRVLHDGEHAVLSRASRAPGRRTPAGTDDAGRGVRARHAHRPGFADAAADGRSRPSDVSTPCLPRPDRLPLGRRHARARNPAGRPASVDRRTHRRARRLRRTHPRHHRRRPRRATGVLPRRPSAARPRRGLGRAQPGRHLEHDRRRWRLPARLRHRSGQRPRRRGRGRGAPQRARVRRRCTRRGQRPGRRRAAQPAPRGPVLHAADS